mmetsp:Transcript_2056/g.5976  ORF Transcript_2056/g.5976 Transcript_2056/m.5976 type:complete len:226 (+) Transcript_2056:705-1382(+)
MQRGQNDAQAHRCQRHDQRPVAPGLHRRGAPGGHLARTRQSVERTQRGRRAVEGHGLLLQHREDQRLRLRRGERSQRLAVLLVQVRQPLRVRGMAEVAGAAVGALARGEVEARPRAEVRMPGAAPVLDPRRARGALRRALARLRAPCGGALADQGARVGGRGVGREGFFPRSFAVLLMTAVSAEAAPVAVLLRQQLLVAVLVPPPDYALVAEECLDGRGAEVRLW